MTLAEVCDGVIRAAQVDLDLDIGEYEPNAALDAPIRKRVLDTVDEIAGLCRMWNPAVALTLAVGDGGPAAPLSLLNTAKVAMRVVRPQVIYIGGTPLLDVDGDPGMWNMEQLERNYSSWRTATNGHPTVALWAGPVSNNLYLYVPADATTAALSGNYIAGEVLPNRLLTDGTNDNTELPITTQLHEAIKWRTAEKSRKGTAIERGTFESIRLYNQEWATTIERMAAEQANARMESFSADAGWGEPNFIET